MTTGRGEFDRSPASSPNLPSVGRAVDPGAYPMLSMEKIRRAQALYLKYVSAKPASLKDMLEKAHECCLQEKRDAESGAIKVSPGLLTELRRECQELATMIRENNE